MRPQCGTRRERVQEADDCYGVNLGNSQACIKDSPWVLFPLPRAAGGWPFLHLAEAVPEVRFAASCEFHEKVQGRLVAIQSSSSLSHQEKKKNWPSKSLQEAWSFLHPRATRKQENAWPFLIHLSFGNEWPRESCRGWIHKVKLVYFK